MRTIITGGTGLIGTALAAELAGAGHEVIVLSRAPARARPPDGVRVVRWDGASAAGWADLADGAGAIVNLAGENIASGLWTRERKRRIRDSRLLAGAAVVEAVTSARERPAVLVQASAVGYYGSRGDEVLNERTGPGADWLARVAVEWEASTAAVEALGVRRVIVRTCPVLTTKAGVLPKLMLPFRYYLGGPLGSGRQWFPWIHIQDEVRAIQFLIENDRASGAYNLGSPEPLTNAQFARTLGRVMGRPCWLPVPALALRLVLGQMAITVLSSQRALPEGLLSSGFRFRHPEAEAALRHLLSSGA